MPQVLVVIRDVGSLKPDYSLEFDLPAVPTIGSYISVHRGEELHGEDLLVKQVWWRLSHPEMEPFGSETSKVGKVIEIIVECDQAIGPYSRDDWRDRLAYARERGTVIPEFEVARMSVRQDAFSRNDK